MRDVRCPVDFNWQQSAVILEPGGFERPISKAKKQLRELAEAYLRLQERPGVSMADRVRTALLRALGMEATVGSGSHPRRTFRIDGPKVLSDDGRKSRLPKGVLGIAHPSLRVCVTIQELEWSEYTRVGPASDEDLQRVEEATGRRFPTDFRPVLMEHQGQMPVPKFVRNPENPQRQINFGALMHCSEAKEVDYIPRVLSLYRRGGYPEWLLPLSTSGGAQTHFAFDFRGSAEAPSIVVVRPELGYESERCVLTIATSFTALVTLFEPEEM